ncbi:MAG: NAD synthase [Candidatus Nanosalina sp. J07AB43]|nr:MAG: NAD synthase [Candidatus Nanosalina sp. J07AB43]
MLRDFIMPEAPVTREEIENAPIKAKIRAGEEVVKRALEEYDPSKTVIGFTGGKDSTLTAWLVKRVCEEHDLEKPSLCLWTMDSTSTSWKTT